MKAFKEFLIGLAEEEKEKETDAQYNLRMRKTTRRLNRIARKGVTQKRKKRNSIRRRPEAKIDTAARERAKREVLAVKVKDDVRPSFMRKLVDRFSDYIDRKEIKLKRILTRQEPKRIKAARARFKSKK